MTFTAGIVGHTARRQQAEALAERIGAWLSLDDGTLGCEGNHRRVLAHLAEVDADHVVVLEDDAQPVEDFHTQVAAALDAAPAPVISFYLGTGYPLRWQGAIRRALQRADHQDAAWITSTRLLHAVGYAIRGDIIDDLLDHMPPLPIDEAITAWCKTRGHQVAYTVPSLVDHADHDTVITRRAPRRRPRRAHRTGTRTNWNSPTTTLDHQCQTSAS